MVDAAQDDELWEVALTGGERKILTLDQLDEAFESGVVNETTLLRELGGGQWQPLYVVAGLEPPDVPVPQRPMPEQDSDPPTRPNHPLPNPTELARAQQAQPAQALKSAQPDLSQTVMGLGPGGYRAGEAMNARASAPPTQVAGAQASSQPPPLPANAFSSKPPPAATAPNQRPSAGNRPPPISQPAPQRPVSAPPPLPGSAAPPRKTASAPPARQPAPVSVRAGTPPQRSAPGTNRPNRPPPPAVRTSKPPPLPSRPETTRSSSRPAGAIKLPAEVDAPLSPRAEASAPTSASESKKIAIPVATVTRTSAPPNGQIGSERGPVRPVAGPSAVPPRAGRSVPPPLPPMASAAPGASGAPAPPSASAASVRPTGTTAALFSPTEPAPPAQALTGAQPASVRAGAAYPATAPFSPGASQPPLGQPALLQPNLVQANPAAPAQAIPRAPKLPENLGAAAIASSASQSRSAGGIPAVEWVIYGVFAAACLFTITQRNGLLHDWAKAIGSEAAYLSFEQDTLGGPSLNTPRGVQLLLKEQTTAGPASPGAAVPAAPTASAP